MDDREKRFLRALSGMALQYLSRGEDLDNLAMCGGEHAMILLAEYGLITMEKGQCRFGRCTPRR